MSEKLSLSKTIEKLEEMIKKVIGLQKEAYSLRQEAILKSKRSDELVSRSKDIEKHIYDFAISNLGEKQGKLAYTLVVSDYDGVLTSSSIDEADIFSDEKIDMYGISILLKNKEEADQVVEYAMDKNLYESPYAKDRGKNAWRRMLFDAVREEHSIEVDVDNSYQEDEDSEIVDYDLEISHYSESETVSAVETYEEEVVEPVSEPVKPQRQNLPKLPSFLKDL